MVHSHRALHAVSLAVFLAGSVAHADAPVERFRIDPRGRIIGVLLADGTEIRTSSQGTAALRREVRPGDTVQVTYTATGDAGLAVQRTGHVLDLGPANNPPGSPATVPVAGNAGPFPADAVPFAVVGDATDLPPASVQGRVEMVTHTRAGMPTGFVLEGGAQVSVVPSLAGFLLEVRRGEALQVEGRGGTGPDGTGLWALTITSVTRGVLLDMNLGPGPVELRVPGG